MLQTFSALAVSFLNFLTKKKKTTTARKVVRNFSMSLSKVGQEIEKVLQDMFERKPETMSIFD